MAVDHRRGGVAIGKRPRESSDCLLTEAGAGQEVTLEEAIER